MKVLVFDRKSDDEYIGNEPVEIIPDSAIIKDNKPFFIPDTRSQWSAYCGVAVRIGRLGKNIPEKFAHRYIEAYAPCITTTAEGRDRGNALSRCHEGAIIIGEWQPAESQAAGFRFEIGGKRVEIAIEPETAARMVARAGSHGVMKIGDIIVMCEDEIEPDLHPDTKLEATPISHPDSTPLLSFRIK